MTRYCRPFVYTNDMPDVNSLFDPSRGMCSTFSFSFDEARKLSVKTENDALLEAQENSIRLLRSRYRRCYGGGGPPLECYPEYVRSAFKQSSVLAGLNEKRGHHDDTARLRMALEVDTLTQQHGMTVKDAIKEVYKKSYPQDRFNRPSREEALEHFRRFYYSARNRWGGRLYYPGPEYRYTTNGIWVPVENGKDDLRVEQEWYSLPKKS